MSDVNYKISFCAKPLYNVKISRYNKLKKTYESCPATFVIIDSSNANDLKAINKLPQIWKDADYIKSIRTAANWSTQDSFKNIKIYALTLQKNNLDNLQSGHILGLAEARERKNPKKIVLNHFQVNPRALNVDSQTDTPTHKGCGTAILNSLKNIYNKISLTSANKKLLKRFYRRNGFWQNLIIDDRFSWNAGPIRRFVRFIREFSDKHT